MGDFARGANSGDESLGRRFPAGLALLGWTLTLVTAWLERAAHPVYASYGALLGAVFGVAVPLYGYCLVGRLSSGRAESSIERWTRVGANRRWLRAGESGVALGWCCLFSLVAGGGALLVTGAPPGASLFGDLGTTLGVGFLGAAGYLGLFLAASSLWRRAGTTVALAADWMFGSGADFGGVLFPRAHLRALLGGEPVLDLSQKESSVALAGLAVILLGVFLTRTPP